MFRPLRRKFSKTLVTKHMFKFMRNDRKVVTFEIAASQLLEGVNFDLHDATGEFTVTIPTELIEEVVQGILEAQKENRELLTASSADASPYSGPNAGG